MKTLEADGLRPVALRIDVASTESIRLAKKEVEERYGRLDVLVNNAAVLLSVYHHPQHAYVINPGFSEIQWLAL